jgi:hypothetical protein
VRPLIAIPVALVLAAGVARAQETAAPEDRKDQEQEKEDHEGFLFRLTVGLGWAFLYGDGALAPSVGMRRIEDPEHDSPALNLSLDVGGGFKNLGIHVGGVVEKMILRADDPTEMGFTLFGVGGGLSYYFTKYDFYATAQARFVGLMVYVPGVLCDAALGEKYQWYRGPGVTVGLGKEWFGDDDKGLGLGVQVNYAKLKHGSYAEFDYVSVMLALTFTKF